MTHVGNDGQGRSDTPDGAETDGRSGLMSRAAGSLIGLVPGLLLWSVGIAMTEGNDLFTFALVGTGLAFLGFIAGYLWGTKTTGWLRDHVVGSLVAGLAAVLLLAGVLFAFGD